ncbi:MAG: CoA transferase [Chloroflexi bacterium]|nr:CoA transferase [Chloroflexota bacterium]
MTSAGMLAPYRVLDLSDEAGQSCGKILADLGADVIKVEPPGGDPARRRPPFVDDEPGPDRGLYWLACNANKRSFEADLETEAGRALFRRLAATADVVVESFAPGRMTGWGLDFPRLAAINPGLVLVSISPFGQQGPHRDYRGPDIVTWAMSGLMSICGEPSGPPAQISDNAQSSFAAGGDAAVGALLALLQRRRSGRGQHVDVSIQESVIRSSFQVAASWDMERRNLPRAYRPSQTPMSWTWRCRDGYVVWLQAVGPYSSTRAAGFFAWLRDEGEGADLLALDWEAMVPWQEPPADWSAVVAATAAVFAKYTKAELYAAAMTYGFSLFPVDTAADTMANPQLEARDFWRDVPHPALDRAIRLPGPFARATRTPPRAPRPAPRLGEHTAEILAELPPAEDSAPVAQAAATEPPGVAMPLAGVKVLDLSWFMVGPMTTKVLADYGADVVHVESNVRIDGQRTSGPFRDGVRDPELCADYAQVRTSQRSIALDIAQPGGRDVVLRMADWADVVVNNFSGGAMERMGLGYEALRARNPAIIYLGCSGQGETGPHRHSRGGGGHYAALAGFNHLTGRPGDPPGYLSAYTDFIAPRFNVALLLAALDHRDRTGLGHSFDVSQYETSMHWLAPSLLDYSVNGRVAGRQGNRQAGAAPHGAYRCRDDRWCVIAVRDEAEWQAFRAAIGDPAWAGEQRFATHAARKSHEDALDVLVEAWTRERTPEAVMTTLQGAGVAAGVVQRGEDLLEHDPQLRHRGFWQPLDHPTIGRYHAPRHAFRLPDAPCALRRSRMIGEDTAEVLRDVLGLSEAEIADLAADGLLQ